MIPGCNQAALALIFSADISAARVTTPLGIGEVKYRNENDG